MSKVNYKSQFIKLLDKISKTFPNKPLSIHLYGALVDYPDFSEISDKELVYALEKYSAQMELEDIISPRTTGIDQIIEDAMHLTDTIDDEDF